jgi:hypothetical protein
MGSRQQLAERPDDMDLDSTARGVELLVEVLVAGHV